MWQQLVASLEMELANANDPIQRISILKKMAQTYRERQIDPRRAIELYEQILVDASFPKPKDGYIELPTKPGLGIDLDEKALTGKPFAWKPALSLGRLWRSENSVIQYPNY